MIDDTTFFAWLDGELSQDEAARVAQEVARNAELSAKAERHRAMVQWLRGAFDNVLTEPVPLPSAEIVRLRPRQSRPIAMSWWQQAAAVAALLVLGVVIGREVARPSAPFAEKEGKLVAAASLDEALTKRLASAPAESGVRIAMTFRDRYGRICRTFTDPLSNGLACNEEGRWVVEALTGGVEGQSSTYRMAASPSPEVARMAERLIDGDPFDARQERDALQRGWR